MPLVLDYSPNRPRGRDLESTDERFRHVLVEKDFRLMPAIQNEPILSRCRESIPPRGWDTPLRSQRLSCSQPAIPIAAQLRCRYQRTYIKPIRQLPRVNSLRSAQ